MPIEEKADGNTAWGNDYRSMVRRINLLAATPQDTGALANGSFNDTTAMDLCRASTNTIYLPPGRYMYSGTGWEADNLSLVGAGAGNTVVELGAGTSLIKATAVTDTMHVSGITFVGGFGSIRLGYTGASVRDMLVVEDCKFFNYTGAAISSLSVDQPYWSIRRCLFDAANDTGSTFGIVLAGDNAQSVIEHNQFVDNRVHLKIGQNTAGNAGGSVKVLNNDFIRFTAYSGTRRTDIWLVPRQSNTNQRAFNCQHNKFGNENINANDFRVLYAEEDTGSGADAVTRQPLLADISTRMSGHRYSGNLHSGSSGNAPAFVTSYTTDLRAQAIVDHEVTGTPPAAILAIAHSAIPAPPASPSNIVGPVLNQDSSSVVMAACNVSGYVRTIDPTSRLSDSDDQKRTRTSNLAFTSDTALATLLSIPVGANGLWQVDGVVFVDGATAGDAKLLLQATSATGVTGTFGINGNGVPTTGTNASIVAATGGTPLVIDTLGSGIIQAIAFTAFVDTSTVAGTLELQGAQNTSNATATTFRTGSWMRAVRVGN